MGRFYRILFLSALLMPAHGWAQKMDCEQTIAYANEEFNAGHFFSVPSILSECLKSFSREQRQRAFLLLTQTYLLLDDPVGAEKSFREVLTANPEFIADEQLHSIDIVYLSKKFIATPIFSWIVSAGSNVSPVRLIIDNDPAGKRIGQHEKKNFILVPGYHAGVGGEYSYNANLNVRMGVDYIHSAYKSNAIHFLRDTKEFVDRQSWISVPLYVSYGDNVGKYRPYGYLGYSFSYLFNDQGSIKLRNTNGVGAEREVFDVQSPDLNLLKSRNQLNQSIIFGGGVKYKLGLDFLFAELRYSVGLRNLTNNLYGNDAYDPASESWVKSFEAPGEYTHVDDFFRLDNLSISFGFLRPLYKPRELKRARTKGVLRKMKKSK
jgi:hypothetical protein